MKVCVYGAGAIGGHLAARLAAGGSEVSLVARGAQLAALRSCGLTVRAPEATLHTTPVASADPRELGRQDAVIVAVKAPALPAVAAAIGPLLGPDTEVVFAMNGVPWWYFDHHGGPLEGRALPTLDPGGVMRAAVGVGRAAGGVVYSSCTVTEPGVVHVADSRHRIVLGRPDGAAPPMLRRLSDALQAGGMTAPISTEIRREIWMKLAINLSSGPLCMLSGLNCADTFRSDAVVEAAKRMTEEAMAIAAATLGRPLEIDMAARIASAKAMQHKPSILQDMELGRPLEVDALFRVPLELARLFAVPTPTLDLVVDLACQAAQARGLLGPSGEPAEN